MSESLQPTEPANGKTVPASAILSAEVPTPTAPAPAPVAETSAAAATPAAPGSNVETDAGGVPFDPARHLNKKHPVSGRWMPRGGRKAGRYSAPTSSGLSPGASSSPGAVSSESFIPSKPPAAPQPVEQVETVDGGSPRKSVPLEVVDKSEDAAEVACRAAQFGASVVFGSPEDCTPAPATHKHMVRTVAGYIRSKGWEATAGVALALMAGAWLLDILNKPRPLAKVRGWIGLDEKPAPAAGVKTPADQQRAPAAAAPSSSGLPPGIPPLASS